MDERGFTVGRREGKSCYLMLAYERNNKAARKLAWCTHHYQCTNLPLNNSFSHADLMCTGWNVYSPFTTNHPPPGKFPRWWRSGGLLKSATKTTILTQTSLLREHNVPFFSVDMLHHHWTIRTMFAKPLTLTVVVQSLPRIPFLYGVKWLLLPFCCVWRCIHLLVFRWTLDQ